MTSKNKYYVVWKGNQPGIYNSWDECQMQIKGFKGAVYKAFENLTEAQTAFQNQPIFKKATKENKVKEHSQIIWESISVDAACSGNPGLMEYRGVNTKTKEQIFHQGPFPIGTNNIGEFLAIVHALALCQKKGLDRLVIYTDSKTAMSWLKNKKVKTNLEQNHATEILFNLIRRAELWLQSNSFRNPIIKWETDTWGEIPADFGRK